VASNLVRNIIRVGYFFSFRIRFVFKMFIFLLHLEYDLALSKYFLRMLRKIHSSYKLHFFCFQYFYMNFKNN